MGQLPETSVIQNVPNPKSIIDHTIENILETDFEKVCVEVPSMNFKDLNNYIVL